MRERILAFMDDMKSNNAERVSEWFAEECEVWIPPCKQISGKSRVKALFRAMFGRYQYITWEILEIIPISETRCIHICNSIGKIKGREEYRNQVITDISFDSRGKIISLSDYFKDTAVFNKDVPESAIVNLPKLAIVK